MVAKKTKKKEVKVNSKKLKRDIKAIEEEKNSGSDLDDAFADDDNVEYAESKPKKVVKISEEELEEELDEAENLSSGGQERGDIVLNASKPIGKVKKGDKVSVDGKQLEVDAHFCLIDHGSTKEMAIELFDPKDDKDYQLRYFDDQV
ncbi:MAG: hypothetical protein Q7R87_01755, partial [Nanoarchaeota archaeon]|nr:hypothetical protein [Nanoarchaeota archaeon]